MHMRMLESNPQSLLTLETSRDRTPRLTDHLAKTFDFVISQELDFVESIQTLLLNDYLGCGVDKSDTDEHGTHSIYSCHVGFGVQMKVLKVLIQFEF
jgi:hypothetical protein